MVNLDVVLVEIVVRAGNPDVATLIKRYEFDTTYRVFGISVVFHPGYTLDQLAQAAHFPHARLSYSTVAELRANLQQVGFDLVLYQTPDIPALPEHHTLAVSVNGLVQQTLDPVAAQAIKSVLHVVPNAHQSPSNP